MHKHPDVALDRARSMRRQPTLHEAIVWRWLRGRRFRRWKFRRQYPVGNAIVDFYCYELKLAIELDGAGHEAKQFYDVARDCELSKLGVTVVRIPNALVLRDPTTAADWIMAAIERCARER
jgi:very-short-patch-repair endonuclease